MLNVRVAMFCTWKNSSLVSEPRPMISEVSFIIAIVSLPVGGTITRIAWGSTTRRISSARVIPSEDAASVCPSSTDRMPARTISAM